ncbi:hypothetical protein GA0115246_100773 [Streptomyces sp. SolWspMP-sol7th]|nr:hypothetical protein GA0115246_100773 [Streptomyces sp. SolWspMP-sol7th]
MDEVGQAQRPAGVLGEDSGDEGAAAEAAHVRRGGGERGAGGVAFRGEVEHVGGGGAGEEPGGEAGEEPSGEEGGQSALEDEAQRARGGEAEAPPHGGAPPREVGPVPGEEQHRDDADRVHGEDDRHHELTEAELFAVEAVERGRQGRARHADGEDGGGERVTVREAGTGRGHGATVGRAVPGRAGGPGQGVSGRPRRGCRTSVPATPERPWGDALQGADELSAHHVAEYAGDGAADSGDKPGRRVRWEAPSRRLKARTGYGPSTAFPPTQRRARRRPTARGGADDGGPEVRRAEPPGHPGASRGQAGPPHRGHRPRARVGRRARLAPVAAA